MDQNLAEGKRDSVVWRQEANKRLAEAEAIVSAQRTFELLEDTDCLGKEKYPSEAAVRASIADWNRRPGRHDARMEPYACIHCGSWHVGHPIERQVRNKRVKAQKGRRCA